LFQNTLGEREREVPLELAVSAMFSSLEIKGNEEVDLTIVVMDPQGQGQVQGQYHVQEH
jgi:C4-type Zn-finger protein